MDITISKNCKNRILYHLSEEFGINISWEDISSIEILNDSFHVFVKGHGEYLLFYKKF